MQKLDDYSAQLSAWADNEMNSALALSQWLYDKFKPNSVIDIGCGAGQFLIPFKWRDCYVTGVDGDETAGALLDQDEFKQADLRLPQDFNEHGLALCLEVIEHLQPEYENILIKTLIGSAKIIVFSGAKPNQIGTNHYNCQPKDYWIAKFKFHSYELMPETTQLINFMYKHKAFDATPWLRENIFMVSL